MMLRFLIKMQSLFLKSHIHIVCAYVGEREGRGRKGSEKGRKRGVCERTRKSGKE